MRAMIASGMVPERHGRQDQVPDAVDERLPLERDEAVERVDAGDEIEEASRQTLRGLRGPNLDERDDVDARSVARRRQRERRPFQDDGEDVRQQQAQHEHRHRDADVGARPSCPRPTAELRLIGRDDAERDAEPIANTSARTPARWWSAAAGR